MLKELCYIYPIKSSLGAIIRYPKENIYDWTNRNPWNRKFTEMDKFLLQKLYADDFNQQFSSYMHKAYPYRYASYFVNPAFAKLKVIVFLLLVGVFVFIISFNFFQNKKFKFSYLNYFLPCFVILVYTANFYNIYNFMLNMDATNYIESLKNLYITALLFTLFYSFLLWGLEKIAIKKRFHFTLQLALKVSITFIVLNLPLLILYILDANYYDNEALYSNFGEQLFMPFFIITTFLTLLRGLLIYLNHISKSLVYAKDVELSQLKEINSQAEVKLLQSQINPHFLYNALNSIASLAHKNADKTEKMALSLSDLFKYTINRKGKKDSTIGDEVEMVKNYLEVEQIRFDDRLHFTIDVDKSLENTKIPMFLIQPLIENAVKHGISKVEKNGQITLCIQKTETGFIIVVEDNGPNFPDGLVSGYGLQTVFDLLRLTYKEKASINWKNTPTKHIKITIENEL